MGIIGHGYGSEFHLLRYLGYHRRELNRKVEQETAGRVLDWLDLSFGTKRAFPYLDAEWKGVDFLDPDAEVRSAWKDFWPQTGNVPNWDAVGILQSEAHVEYLLVEAKAHISEIESNCGAKADGGLERIRDAFRKTIQENGFSVDPERWLIPYYQYANRLAHLHFLLQHSISASLVFIYFLGDKWPAEALVNRGPVYCPDTEQKWKSKLKEMYDHLGLAGASRLEQRVHSLFLPV